MYVWCSVEAFPMPKVSYLSDCAQQLSIAEHNRQERHNEAEYKQADDVRDVIRCLWCPVDWTGGPRALRAIVAPAKERRQGPEEGVHPRQGDAQGNFTVVGGVRLSGGHHGAVALIGEDSKGDEGYNACSKVDRTHTCIGKHQMLYTCRHTACWYLYFSEVHTRNTLQKQTCAMLFYS